MRAGIRVCLPIALLALGAAQAETQQHASCYLQATGQLNWGTNPSWQDLRAEALALSIERRVPHELVLCIAMAESSMTQFGPDGFLIHNKTECSKLFNGQSAPNPPGLGLMQLTGSTALAYDLDQLRLSWEYNLWAGVDVLLVKLAIAKSVASPQVVAAMEANRHVLETWYNPVWFYNGWVPNSGSYVDKVFGHAGATPGSLAGSLGEGIALATPDEVIGHAFEVGFGGAYGEAFAANADGTWLCEHGDTWTGPASFAAMHAQTLFGAGSPGCAGAQRLMGGSLPRVGAASFELLADHAPPGGAGVLALGTAPDLGGSDPLGLNALLHLSLSGALWIAPLVAGPQGHASFPLPLPLQPTLSGKTVFAQALWAPSGACFPGFTSSRGLELRIQGPGTLPQERIVNGSFTAGVEGWNRSGDFWAGTQFSVFKTAPGYAAGGLSASGVSLNNADGQMWQQLLIPPGASTAWLRLWTCVTTEEVAAIAYDFLTVSLRDETGNVILATPLQLSNLDAGALGEYVLTQFDLSPWRGQRVRIHLQATTDVGKTTIFRVDGVSVVTD